MPKGRSVASNGAGSAVVAWIEQNAGQYQLYAQKLDTSGVLGWATKKQVNTTTMDFSSLCGIALDLTGNSFFDWTRDYEMGGVYAQKLDASGAKLWNSGADVPLTASSPTFADDGRDVAIDPSGNSYMAYVGYCGVNYSTCTMVQKLDASGNKGWLASTAQSSDERYQQRGTAIAYDSTTGIFLAWQDEHNANWDIYANRLYTDNTSAWVTYTQVIAPDSFHSLAGTVQSRQVNTGTETVRSALLTADYELNSGSVQFSLSNNGGVTWYPVLPGVTQVFTTTGSDLRWRADLTADPLRPVCTGD